MIEFDRIYKRYGTTMAIKGLSLSVERGETLALVGPNGAGKTTLIRMLVGLVRPTSGVARVAGCDALHEGVAVRRLLGYLPQRAVLYGNLSVSENLSFLAQMRGISMLRVADIMALLHLEQFANRSARKLSGGLLQRLGLAQALLADPPVLVLDEPTVGLDPLSIAACKTLLREMRAAGKTILLSSHILADVEELADRVAILSMGQLVALDSVAGLVQRCNLPEHLSLQLAKVQGREEELARNAGATVAELRGLALELEVPRDRKIALIQALFAAGVAICNFHSKAPTLEAIFTQFVGQPDHENEPTIC